MFDGTVQAKDQEAEERLSYDTESAISEVKIWETGSAAFQILLWRLVMRFRCMLLLKQMNVVGSRIRPIHQESSTLGHLGLAMQVQNALIGDSILTRDSRSRQHNVNFSISQYRARDCAIM